ncbi:MAG: hypothetical protein D6812_01895 [Deltaproteobacteria bacterium]|nr:MAG: hypothetical protein D6812_01895 [Deltaproteobacteria bacterium]
MNATPRTREELEEMLSAWQRAHRRKRAIERVATRFVVPGFMIRTLLVVALFIFGSGILFVVTLWYGPLPSISWVTRGFFLLCTLFIAHGGVVYLFKRREIGAKIARLQTEREKVIAQIAELERHLAQAGISPGAIPPDRSERS